jgi:RimJ/RimL family protein N-acetyltransferase
MRLSPVVTDRLLLRPVTPDDSAAFLTWRSRPEVVKYMYQAPWTPEVAASKLAAWSTGPFAQAGDVLVLAITLPESRGRVVGEVLLKWAAGVRQAELGYGLHPDVAGRGYAAEAAAAMLDVAFGTFEFHRVFARIDEANMASVRLVERLGLRREARLVENDMLDGEWSTEVVYAILDREWSR